MKKTLLLGAVLSGVLFASEAAASGGTDIVARVINFLIFIAILWYLVGYSLCFSGDVGGIIGNLDKAFLHGVTATQVFGDGHIPIVVFISYQMMFAIITPALITGAFTNRIKFGPYVIFLILWQLFVYFPFVHMIWGNGILQQWGVLDFAGGIVVHATAGMAALASVIYVGKRKVMNKGPHSIPLVALGTGLLWFGWYGFNAGSELRVDHVTAMAFLNTDIAASFAAITWLIIEYFQKGKPKFLGLLTGAVAGLATITPAAGYVTISSAVIIGIIAGTVSFFAVEFKNKMGWDDALDVWGVHGVGGMTGVILLGIFADKSVNIAGSNGLIFGNGGFFIKETITVLGAGLYAFIFTLIILKLINLFMTVKVSEKDEKIGVDSAVHGEEAYL